MNCGVVLDSNGDVGDVAAPTGSLRKLKNKALWRSRL